MDWCFLPHRDGKCRIVTAIPGQYLSAISVWTKGGRRVGGALGAAELLGLAAALSGGVHRCDKGSDRGDGFFEGHVECLFIDEVCP